MSTCVHCNGSGEIDAMGLLDCVHCDAATQRAALNTAVAALPRMPQSDLLWHCYQAGVMAERERMQKFIDTGQVL